MRRLAPSLLLAASIAALPLVLACGRDEPRFRPVSRSAPGEARPAAAAAAAGPAAAAAPAAAGDLAAPSDVAAPPADAERTSTGLASRVLAVGTGSVHPTLASTVRVHYTGWQTDGTMFDSSRSRGEPAEFPVTGVIAGWTEGLQLMVEGEQRRFWIPADLAYGDPPRRPGAPGGMLVFDVELLNIR